MPGLTYASVSPVTALPCVLDTIRTKNPCQALHILLHHQSQHCLVFQTLLELRTHARPYICFCITSHSTASVPDTIRTKNPCQALHILLHHQSQHCLVFQTLLELRTHARPYICFCITSHSTALCSRHY